MKRRIIIAILALLPTMALRAQDTNTRVYQSVFGDSLTEWDVLTTPSENLIDAATTLHLVSDSVVLFSDLGIEYISFKWEGSIYRGFYFFNTPLIRESFDHSKLYYNDGRLLFYGNNPDILLMDLSLEEGDTLNTSTWPHSSFMDTPTILIDSIYYSDGRKIMRTNYIRLDDTLLFIEGIGPSMGFTYAPFWLGQLNILLCYHRDEQLIILDKHFGGICDTSWETGDYWNIDDVQDNDESLIALYPNPVRDVLHIEMADGEPATLSFVSTDGRPMLRQELQGEHTAVDVSALPSGVYTLIISNKQRLITKKIVKL